MVAVEFLGVHVLLNFGGGNVLDVGLAGVELVDLEVVEVEAGDELAFVRKAQAEREADVAAADDADFQAFSREKFGLSFHTHFQILRNGELKMSRTIARTD